MTEARLGKMPTTAVRRLISLFSRSWGFVERIWRRWLSGKARWVSRSGWASVSSSATAGKRGRPETVDHPVELGPGRALVGLLEDHPDGRRDHAPGGARDEVLGVAREMDPAALPAGAQELLSDGLDEARVVVADDEPHAVQPALDERAHEPRPGRALVVARGELEPEHPPLAGRGDARRDETGHRGHPAGLAHLDVVGTCPENRWEAPSPSNTDAARSR